MSRVQLQAAVLSPLLILPLLRNATFPDNRSRGPNDGQAADTAVRVFLAPAVAGSSPLRATAILTGTASRTRTLWWGYVGNAATLAALVWLAAILTRTLRTRRAEARERAGLCPQCRYATEGVPWETRPRRCPECGQALFG